MTPLSTQGLNTRRADGWTTGALWPSAIPGERMEHLWSPADATGGNRRRMGRAQKPLKQVDPQPVATHGNHFAAHGKEGVSGSSPEEGSHESPAKRDSSSRFTVQFVCGCPGMEQVLEQPAEKGCNSVVSSGIRPPDDRLRQRIGHAGCMLTPASGDRREQVVNALDFINRCSIHRHTRSHISDRGSRQSHSHSSSMRPG